MKTIKSKRDFERVFSGGRRANHRLVRMTVLRTHEGGPTRVAFVCAKRLGNAVFRNRSKRVLREAFRAADMPQEGFDVILFATQSTYDAHPQEVARALEALMRRFVRTRQAEES